MVLGDSHVRCIVLYAMCTFDWSVYIHTYIHILHIYYTNTYAHTYTYIYIHADIYIYIHIKYLSHVLPLFLSLLLFLSLSLSLSRAPSYLSSLFLILSYLISASRVIRIPFSCLNSSYCFDHQTHPLPHVKTHNWHIKRAHASRARVNFVCIICMYIRMRIRIRDTYIDACVSMHTYVHTYILLNNNNNNACIIKKYRSCFVLQSCIHIYILILLSRVMLICTCTYTCTCFFFVYNTLYNKNYIFSGYIKIVHTERINRSILKKKKNNDQC